MADNYLEKRYEEVFGPGAKSKGGPHRPALDTLLLRPRGILTQVMCSKMHKSLKTLWLNSTLLLKWKVQMLVHALRSTRCVHLPV